VETTGGNGKKKKRIVPKSSRQGAHTKNVWATATRAQGKGGGGARIRNQGRFGKGRHTKKRWLNASPLNRTRGFPRGVQQLIPPSSRRISQAADTGKFRRGITDPPKRTESREGKLRKFCNSRSKAVRRNGTSKTRRALHCGTGQGAQKPAA